MRRTLLVVLSAASALPLQAAAPTVRIGSIESEKSCSLYQMTAGHHREAGVVDRYGAAYASETSWRTYLVRDCVNHFASLRTSLQAALAASGKLAVIPGTSGGGYVVSGRISEVSGGGPAERAERPWGNGASISSSSMFVNMDVTVRDASGRIVYGGLLTKRIETGFSMETQGLSSSSVRSGQALYTELQHQVALAVARIVAFRIEPLRVTGSSGRRIQLNYGAPLLQLGALVQVTNADGQIGQFRVSAAGQDSAQAEPYGDEDATAVAPGSRAMVIEDDNPAANGRRFEKVELP